ncbi:Replication termination factor 2 [Mucor velutinosus]|uniref:Replication termination factor 2 n=1 Tax=Mucor velutinosus TaxID=708070 RepID=A0AAN7I3P2_9FUNG|nr:Replication termination factor 2 [Mucor velutinosus]
MSYYTDFEHTKAPYSVRIVKFGCENCGRRWQSANGSLSDYQKCRNCYERCYPSSYKIQAPNKRGNENRGTFQAHDTELCGRCERLGYSCMELGNAIDQDNLLVTGADDEDVVLTKSNDLFSYVVEPKIKRGKNKAKNEKSRAIFMDSRSDIDVYNTAHRLTIVDTVYYNKNDDALDFSKYNYLSDEQKMYEDSFYNMLDVEEY